MTTPALYDVRIDHVRVEPVRNAFTYRGYQWFVDLDAIPVLPRPLRPFGSFLARDHVGDPARSIKENIEAVCAARGIDVRGGRITMLSQARVLGYVFNPLSVFWCRDAAGTLRCTVAEVHNTYGQRHSYVLETDERGRAMTDKAFFVSPFLPVDGRYQMSVPEPEQRLDLTITLHRAGAKPFVASMHGRRLPLTSGALLHLTLRHPISPLVGSLRIRRQGIGLWLRGLRPASRPAHHQEGLS